MTIYHENIYHIQKLQKQAYIKDVKPANYTLGDKIWLNSIYIKNKQNQKLELKFFNFFSVFHPVEKQAYKHKLLKK